MGKTDEKFVFLLTNFTETINVKLFIRNRLDFEGDNFFGKSIFIERGNGLIKGEGKL